MVPVSIRAITLGHYTMPAGSALGGQKIVARGYVVRYAAGLLLFDTGIGEGDPDAEQTFGPIQRRPLPAALASVGVRLQEVTMVMNCHFHLDHCGGNPLFPRTPIFAQRAELAAMGDLDYVLPELIDFAGARIEACDGVADIAPGLRILPTPGHTPGHQSLLVDSPEGPVLLAGQAMGMASDFARAQFEISLREDAAEQPGRDLPAWVHQVMELGVREVMFAHDTLSWTQHAGRTSAPAG